MDTYIREITLLIISAAAKEASVSVTKEVLTKATKSSGSSPVSTEEAQDPSESSPG